MKKILAALAFMIYTTFAMAGGFVGVEGEFENGISSTHDTYSLSVIPGYAFDNGIKFDAKLQGSQNDTNDTSIAVEPRVSYGVKVAEAWTVGMRASVGEKFQKGGNYNFYTVEPYATYDINKNFYLKTSLKLKDSFSSKDIQTETIYLGGGYKFGKNEVSAKAYRRFDSTESTGIEANYTVYF